MPDGAILLLLCILPVLGALGVAVLPKCDSGLPRLSALLLMLGVLVLATGLSLAGDGTVASRRLDLNLPWIPSRGTRTMVAC